MSLLSINGFRVLIILRRNCSWLNLVKIWCENIFVFFCLVGSFVWGF